MLYDNNLDIYQEELLIDVCIQEDAIQLLVNSREQIIVEKLKSLLRFMSTNTRFKDVFDICFYWKIVMLKFLKSILRLLFMVITLCLSATMKNCLIALKNYLEMLNI